REFHVTGVQTCALPISPEYLAYGPFSQRRPAIDAGDGAELRLAVPEERWPELERVLGLMHRFGTVGSSSRNGWGAYALEDAPERSEERRVGKEGRARGA